MAFTVHSLSWFPDLFSPTQIPEFQVGKQNGWKWKVSLPSCQNDCRQRRGRGNFSADRCSLDQFATIRLPSSDLPTCPKPTESSNWVRTTECFLLLFHFSFNSAGLFRSICRINSRSRTCGVCCKGNVYFFVLCRCVLRPSALIKQCKVEILTRANLEKIHVSAAVTTPLNFSMCLPSLF